MPPPFKAVWFILTSNAEETAKKVSTDVTWHTNANCKTVKNTGSSMLCQWLMTHLLLVAEHEMCNTKQLDDCCFTGGNESTMTADSLARKLEYKKIRDVSIINNCKSCLPKVCGHLKMTPICDCWIPTFKTSGNNRLHSPRKAPLKNLEQEYALIQPQE